LRTSAGNERLLGLLAYVERQRSVAALGIVIDPGASINQSGDRSGANPGEIE
jgi:hypothetical protein